MDTLPPTLSATLHVPLVASSLRIAFQHQRHVQVWADSEEVEVYHRGARLLTIQADGELILDDQAHHRDARCRHANTVFDWIGIDERLVFDQEKGWCVDQRPLYDQFSLFHPNVHH